MIVRLAAGLIGLAVLVPALVFGGSIAVGIIVLLAMGVCLYEYSRMAFPARWAEALGWLSGATILPFGAHLLIGAEAAWAVLGLCVITLSTRVALRPGPSLERAWDDLGRYVFGAVWIGLLVFMPLLRELPGGLAWIFMALGLAWLSDTGAYFAGRFLGRTPLHPTLSPKKTVEGYVGGVIAATLGTAWFAYGGVPVWEGSFADGGFVMQAVEVLHVGDVLAVGVGIGTLGVVGDLAESLVKRATGVKDAGNILPGHGGLLDRVDSLLFVAPALYGYAMLVKGVSV